MEEGWEGERVGWRLRLGMSNMGARKGGKEGGSMGRREDMYEEWKEGEEGWD